MKLNVASCQPLRSTMAFTKRPDSPSAIRIKHQQEKDLFKKMETIKNDLER